MNEKRECKIEFKECHIPALRGMSGLEMGL